MRITKLLGALALSGILAAGVEASAQNPYAPTGNETVIGRTQVLSYTASAGANTLSGAALGASDGWSIKCMNESKTLAAGGGSITIGDKNYKTIKLSNGAQNTITLPEGYIANAVTIYAVINKDAATNRPCYWAEVDGTKCEAPTTDHITSFKDFANPTVSYFKLSGTKNTFTLTNSGEQPMVVLVVDYTDPNASEIPEGWARIPGILNKIEESTNNTEAGWTIGGAIKYDAQDGQFGNIKNGGWCSTNFFCDKEGFYEMLIPFCWDNGKGQTDDIRFQITDQTTGKVEIDQHYTFVKRGDVKINLDSKLTRGRKTFKVTFTGVNNTGFITNIKAPTFNYIEVGEGVVSKVEINGREAEASIVEALNANLSATETGKVYTTVPSVKATFDDDAVAEAVVSVANGNAVAEFTHPILTNKKFALTLEGVQVYNKTEVDQEYTLLYEDSGKDKPTAGNWSNGNYTLFGTSDGWGGKQFKLQINKTQEYTLEIPDNIIVKQLTFGALGDNYQNDGVFETVTSEGANVIIPTDRGFLKGGNSAMTVLFENHVKGAPIKFTVGSTGQPYMNFQLVYERYVYTGEPTNTGKSQTPTDKKNHAVVTFSFDRPMQDCVAEYNGKTVKAYGGKNDLKFSLWDLAWDAETVLTIPAGAAKDVDGNANSAALTYTVNVAAEPTSVDPVETFIPVYTVDDLKKAVAQVMESNKSADARRAIIYLMNGDYDLGTSTAQAPILHLDKAFNVSLIGESRDGVVVHGSIEGISYPVFSTRNSTNIYMENFTIRNDLDWGCFDAEGNGTGKGVGVAHYGGNRDIMVNMCLQSNQDTQVTGEQGYYYNCEIYGSVDFICGGGDHFYDNCTFVTTRKGSVVAAPSTSPSCRWGYVFSNCTIKGIAGYDLGRPWQNEPRCYFINTKMEALANDGGWVKMRETMPTHFYEYNSVDATGNAIDLSTRVNASTSANTYNPVLTAEEAAEFTVENVLGGDDSWLATEEVVTEMTPSAGSEYLHETENGVESEDYWWLPVAKAAGYLVYNHDAFLAYVPGDQTSYDLLKNPLPVVSRGASQNFSFTVRAMSPNGTLSAPTVAITPEYTTGVEGVTAEEAVEVMYYNLQGQPVAEGYRGAAIKVEVAADGTRTVTKTIID